MPTDTLFGIETEYAYSVLTDDGSGLPRATALTELVTALRNQVRWLPGPGDRSFLRNGALFYMDRGGHPEMATPECRTPWEVVHHTLAGERILAAAAACAVRSREGARPLLLKTNVDYLGWQTWGCHESYLTTLPPSAFKRHLVPHLVTRIIYTGAGGFRHDPQGGLAFAISPRVGFIHNEMTKDSTESRGILHGKDEPLAARPYHRLHLICGESICSRIAQLLRVGTTALVVRMIENGMCRRAPIALQSSVQAMHTISADPTLTAQVTTRRRRQVTAIDVQRYYLETAESCAHRSFMPPWAGQICTHWREMLDALESNPRDVAAIRLDWGMKLGLFERVCERAGFSLAELSRWDAATGDWTDHEATVAREAEVFGVFDRTAYIRERLRHVRRRRTDAPATGPGQTRPARQALAEAGLSGERIERFLRLRAELVESDARFAQVGDGIYARLHAAGLLEDGVEGVDDQAVERATVEAPDGRARARGIVIAEHGRHDRSSAFHADWDKVVDLADRKVLDLSDPFNESSRWETFTTLRGLASQGSLATELLLAELEHSRSSPRS